MEQAQFPVNLYFSSVETVTTLDLCRGDDDFRKVCIADDGSRKIAIKHTANSFTDAERISGWIRLMDAYRSLGICCPRAVPNLHGELIHVTCENGRNYYTYAEEFAVYETAEHIPEDEWKDSDGNPVWLPDMLRTLGRVAAARLDTVDWPSAYCLLEPYSPPDTTDEGTECALLFAGYVKEHLPAFHERTQALLDLFYRNKECLRQIYHTLPTSCFQGDLNDSNILLDENHRFAGLIDFNLCGREPILNYTVREALWGISDRCLYGEGDRHLYYYDKTLDDRRIRSFLRNLGYIAETYSYTDAEREAFPILFRYMNSFWWQHVEEIKRIAGEEEKVSALLDWLEFQMTRDDIRLP